MNKYFFCYSPSLHKFLNKTNNIRFVVAAFSEKDHKKFWLYEQSEQLSNALNKYNRLFKGGEAIDCVNEN